MFHWKVNLGCLMEKKRSVNIYHKYQWANTATTCVDRSLPHALQELNWN